MVKYFGTLKIHRTKLNKNCFLLKNIRLGFKWLHDFLGSNYRMTEIQAVIGREQLKTLDRQIKKRNLDSKLIFKWIKRLFL